MEQAKVHNGKNIVQQQVPQSSQQPQRPFFKIDLWTSLRAETTCIAF